MKKAILAIIVLGLCFGLATSAMAQDPTGTTTVTVTVEEIEELTVPATVAITLNTVDATDPSKYATGTFKGTGENGLTYTHNSADPKKITASATYSGSTTHDITITVKVDGGEEAPEPIVSSGTGETEVLLWDNIAADSYTKDLTWSADATLAGTQASTDGYVFEVTFTTADYTAP